MYSITVRTRAPSSYESEVLLSPDCAAAAAAPVQCSRPSIDIPIPSSEISRTSLSAAERHPSTGGAAAARRRGSRDRAPGAAHSRPARRRAGVAAGPSRAPPRRARGLGGERRSARARRTRRPERAPPRDARSRVSLRGARAAGRERGDAPRGKRQPSPGPLSSRAARGVGAFPEPSRGGPGAAYRLGHRKRLESRRRVGALRLRRCERNPTVESWCGASRLPSLRGQPRLRNARPSPDGTARPSRVSFTGADHESSVGSRRQAHAFRANRSADGGEVRRPYFHVICSTL